MHPSFSDRHVITAAHCTYGKRKSDLFVRVGDTSFDTKKEVSNARTLGVKKIFNHPKYDESTLRHDIAILGQCQALNSLEVVKGVPKKRRHFLYLPAYIIATIMTF